MASYQLNLGPRAVVSWDAKPLPPLPLEPGRSGTSHRAALDDGQKMPPRRFHRNKKPLPQELDINNFLEADSRVVIDKSRRTRQGTQPPPVASSVPKDFMSIQRSEDNPTPGRLRHARQKSDQPASRPRRSKATAPTITRVEDLSLPPKVRQIIGIDSPRAPGAATPWDPASTHAPPTGKPGPTKSPRPVSTASVYSQASGHKKDGEMLFHMEDIVEEQDPSDDDELSRRLQSLMQSAGYAAIQYRPRGSVHRSRRSVSDLPPAPRDPPTACTQDQRSSREMYHDLVVELAQSAPALLPSPPQPPSEPERAELDSSSLPFRRSGSPYPKESASYYSAYRRQPAASSLNVSVFDHESSDSEADSESRPLWSPKFAFLGRRPGSKSGKKR